jgi:hypothetical protein
MPDNWPFADLDNLAVITLKRVIQGNSPVLLVTHDADDGGWQFLDGAEAAVEDAALVSLREMVQLDPSLFELADLPVGWSARRSSPGDPWERIDGEEARDLKTISDVEEYGWHVVIIPEDDEGPAFAFSVGLSKNFGHPEVILFGLGIEAMHGIINLIGEEVRQGRRFSESQAASGIIEGFDLNFRPVSHDHYSEYLGTASSYYKGTDYPALQCVWPDRQGRFPWDTGFPESLRALQPSLAPSPPSDTEPG